jgi:DNA ligase (NAD+)
MKVNKIERIKELVKELNQYKHQYYNLNKPTVSDKIYDELFDELNQLEIETEFILSNSPTQTVGYEVKSKLTKVEHPIPLKSLDKTKSIDELIKWINNKEIVLMLKADGLTVELLYDGGKLIQSSTRGNSIIGEDTTHNTLVFKNIPLSIPFKGKLRLAGEAIIHRNDFNEINSKLPEEDKYATPRNLVAGSVRQLDNRICSERNVYFYAFNILEAIDTETDVDTLSDSKYDNFRWLEKLGFTVIPDILITKKVLMQLKPTLVLLIDELKKVAEHMSIPIDGIVGSFNSIEYSNSLSETAHHPLHSIAYKFLDEAETTILRGIEWSVGRTGVVTPVALFDTVILDNTEVSRASLHNLSICEDLELGIGDSISIVKCNQIIPQIEENFTRSNNLEIPDKCPVCGGIAIIEQLNESKVLYCTNKDCSAKLIKKFSHFVSRDAMNIDGFSEAGIELFIEKGFLKTFDDIYNLEKYRNEIVKLEGWGTRSYNKLIEAIEKSRKVKFANFVYALGIPNIGKGSAKILAKYLNNDFQLFIMKCDSGFNFSQLEDFGDVTNQSIYNWFNNEKETDMWLSLGNEIDIIQEEKKELISSNSIFAGTKVYATGSFASYKKEELKAILEGLGAEFTSGYAKSLDYLIVGSLKGSSKEDKAKKDGVKIMTEEEFLRNI